MRTNRPLLFGVTLVASLLSIAAHAELQPGANSYRFAFVYLNDEPAATKFQQLLAENNHTTDLVRLDAVKATDWKKYSAVIVGSDIEQAWSTTEAEAIADAKVPVLGLGEGGYYFFGKLNLGIGSPNGYHGGEVGVKAAQATNTDYWTTAKLDQPASDEQMLYSSSSHVAIFLSNLSPGEIPLGYELRSKSYAPIIEQDRRYVLWGFTGSPEKMTPLGKRLFIHTCLYVAAEPGLKEPSKSIAKSVAGGAASPNTPFAQLMAPDILIVRNENGKEKLRVVLDQGDKFELVSEGGAPAPDVSNKDALGHIRPTVIGSDEDRIAGVPTPSGPTFDSSRPKLPVPTSAGQAEKLNISRMFYCGDDSVKASENFYRGRAVKLWIPVPDGPQAQVVAERVEGNVQYLVPTSDLADGVYCLHTGQFSKGEGAVVPQFCAPFIVRGYGKLQTGAVAVQQQGKAVELSVKIKNEGKGEFDDGFLVVTLQKLSSSRPKFMGRQNLKLKTISANGEVERVSHWDMSKAEPGTYYFHGHVNYTYLYDANALCHVESKPFEWEGTASGKAEAEIKPSKDDASPKNDRFAVYLGCGDTGSPGTIFQLNLAGEIMSEVHTFEAPSGLAFSGDSLAAAIATPRVGGGQSVMVRKDGRIDRMTLSKNFPAPIANAVDYKTQDILVADNEEHTVSRVLVAKEGAVELLFRAPLKADHDHFPSMSIAAVRDGHVIFSASDPPGVYRVPLKADQQLPAPLLPGDCGVAADPKSNRWVVMRGDDLKVFEGVDEKATIPCPGGASFWRYQVLSFAPDGSLFVVLQTGRGMEIQSVDLDTKKFVSHGVWKGGTIHCLAVGPPLPWPKTAD